MSSRKPYDLRDRTFEFSCDAVVFCYELSKESGVLRHIAWQLADSASSAGANLEEAKAAYSRREFAAKNSISLKEMRESLFWLKLIRRCKLAPENVVQPLIQEADELVAMLTSTMKRLHPMRRVMLGTVVSVLLLTSYFLLLTSASISL